MGLSILFPTFLCKYFVTTFGRKPSGTAAAEARVITQVGNPEGVNESPSYEGDKIEMERWRARLRTCNC